MPIRMNRAPFDIELMVTGHTTGVRGSQIVHGKNNEGNLHSVVARSYVLARPVQTGEWWKFTGEWDSNPYYPNQIIATDGEPLPVEGERLAEYIVRHPKLRCGEEGFRIGEKTWKKAIAAAGSADQLARLLDDEDEDSIKALGIGRLTHNLTLVLMHWSVLRGELEGVKFLAKHKVGKRLSKRLIRHYGERVPEILHTNCYRLLAYDSNTETLFNSCQQIADALKYSNDDPRRLQGAVDFVLNFRLDKHGHTAISRKTLLKALVRMFKDESLAERAIEVSMMSGAVQEAPGGLLQSRPVAYAEAVLEHRFVNMLRANADDDHFHWLSEKAERVYSMTEHSLTDEQKAAILLPFKFQLSILTGGAGTGKTTVISSIIRLAHSLEINVYQMALSGQAADVMRRYNADHNIECLSRTIHWYVLPHETSQQAAQKVEPLEFSNNCLVIIDEASMVDLALMNRLIRVLPDSARILMSGDAGQIPPVGAGLVFHRLCLSERMPIAKLTKPHRSAAITGIPAVAESVTNGIPPILPLFDLEAPAPEHGVYFLPTRINKDDPYSLSKALYQVADKLGMKHTQVIATHRKKSNAWGVIQQSVYYINEHFQNQLTKGRARSLKAWGLNEGDPILVRKNVINVGEKGIDLFNGNLGTLINAETPPYKFQFGENVYELSDEDIAKLGVQLGYALTIHSFQGSATECIVIAVTKSQLLDRSLLYTALTRAKRTVVFVGDKGAFEGAVTAPPRCENIITGFDVDRYFKPKPELLDAQFG